MCANANSKETTADHTGDSDLFRSLVFFLICPENCFSYQMHQTLVLTVVSYTCTCFLGCQCPVGLSNGKAKVCFYSGWYYCQNCHQDNSFLIPARLLHNWDTNKHKVSNCSPGPVFNLSKGSDPVVYTDLFS